jgi:exodeoxyribonuclease VII large subunit
MYNIQELSQLISSNLPKKSLQVTAEIRAINLKFKHMYLTLKDDTCSINCAVWNYNTKPELMKLKEGDKVDVEGYLNFYNKIGSLSFCINKLLNVSGKGKLLDEYEKIKQKYKQLGYFDINKKIEPNGIIKNILLLTSETSAAIEDFKTALKSGNYIINQNINIDTINVAVQGTNCPKDIISYLDKNIINNNSNYDLIIITRGGGNFEDLIGFCEPELIECVYKLEIPVLSAIGHEIDITYLDYVADIRKATPSLAGQYIVDHNNNYKNEIKDRIKNKIKNNIYERLNIINNEKNKFKKSIEKIIRKNINEKLKKFNTNIYFIKNNKVLTKNEFKKILKNKESYNIIWNNELINI